MTHQGVSHGRMEPSLEAGSERPLIFQTSAAADYEGKAAPLLRKPDGGFDVDTATNGAWLLQVLPHPLVII